MGSLTQIWKKCNDKKNKHNSWITCYETKEIITRESTVLEILTFANAERIPTIDKTKMGFDQTPHIQFERGVTPGFFSPEN